MNDFEKLEALVLAWYGQYDTTPEMMERIDSVKGDLHRLKQMPNEKWHDELLHMAQEAFRNVIRNHADYFFPTVEGTMHADLTSSTIPKVLDMVNSIYVFDVKVIHNEGQESAYFAKGSAKPQEARASYLVNPLVSKFKSDTPSDLSPYIHNKALMKKLSEIAFQELFGESLDQGTLRHIKYMGMEELVSESTGISSIINLNEIQNVHAYGPAFRLQTGNVLEGIWYMIHFIERANQFVAKKGYIPIIDSAASARAQQQDIKTRLEFLRSRESYS